MQDIQVDSRKHTFAGFVHGMNMYSFTLGRRAHMHGCTDGWMAHTV